MQFRICGIGHILLLYDRAYKGCIMVVITSLVIIHTDAFCMNKFLSNLSVCENEQARMQRKGKRAQNYAFRRSTENRRSHSIVPLKTHQKYCADV